MDRHSAMRLGQNELGYTEPTRAGTHMVFEPSFSPIIAPNAFNSIVYETSYASMK